MSAYYNEVDPHAAQWLRNLIAAGHIAPGEVDERSIIDVQADDLKGFTQCHFFAGIGVWSYALRRAGWPDDRPVWTGSCPCQPFSGAGKGLGHEDERHLWPTWFGLIRESRPHVVFGEQVANGDGYAWLDLVGSDVESIGYALGAVCPAACGVGAPHIRQRLYFVADSTSHGRKEGARYCGTERPLDGSGEGQQRTGDVSALCELADANADGCGASTASGLQHQEHHPESCGHAGGVALGDTQHAGLEGHGRDGDHGHESGRDGAQPAGSASEAGFSGVVVDTEGRGFGVGWDEARTGSGGYADGAGDDGNCTMADTQSTGTGGDVGGVRDQHAWRAAPSMLASGRRGEVNGHWAGADWVWCRDPSGPRWRPVESGAFPLVAIAPGGVGSLQPGVAKLARSNRVGRLRGYGNAIVAEVAVEFIRAYITERGL